LGGTVILTISAMKTTNRCTHLKLSYTTNPVRPAYLAIRMDLSVQFPFQLHRGNEFQQPRQSMDMSSVGIA